MKENKTRGVSDHCLLRVTKTQAKGLEKKAAPKMMNCLMLDTKVPQVYVLLALLVIAMSYTLVTSLKTDINVSAVDGDIGFQTPPLRRQIANSW